MKEVEEGDDEEGDRQSRMRGEEESGRECERIHLCTLGSVGVSNGIVSKPWGMCTGDTVRVWSIRSIREDQTSGEVC